MGLDSGGAGGMHQGLRKFHGRSFSDFVSSVGAASLGAVPGVLHSKAIRKAREAVIVVERSMGADGPWDPVVARTALPLLVGKPVDATVVTRGRETAPPPGRMAAPALIESLSVTDGLFPFQLLPPHLPEVEVEATIKGQLQQALVVVPSRVVTVALCSTSGSLFGFDEIDESFEATFIVELAVV